jgi:tetratricopeptide (TPR) repeat protein
VSALLVLGLVLAAAAARADGNLITPESKEDPEVRQAKALFASGKEQFNHGNYAKALIAFDSAYQHNPLPDLLYNSALCLEFLGDDRAALDRYERFLHDVPDVAATAETRSDAEARVNEIRKRHPEFPAKAGPGDRPIEKPAEKPKAPEPAPMYRRPLMWGVVAAAVVVIVAVVVIGAAASAPGDAPVPMTDLGNMRIRF